MNHYVRHSQLTLKKPRQAVSFTDTEPKSVRAAEHLQNTQHGARNNWRQPC